MRNPGPNATRSSNTSSPTGLESPKFPSVSRAIRSRMIARPFASRSLLSHASKGHCPSPPSQSRTSRGMGSIPLLYRKRYRLLRPARSGRARSKCKPVRSRPWRATVGVMKYPVALVRTEEGYSVSCPGLPGCWSQGATEEEALENIREALREYLEVAKELAGDVNLREADIPA
jgi:predicted RNase H-like HicB family nuclease